MYAFSCPYDIEIKFSPSSWTLERTSGLPKCASLLSCSSKASQNNEIVMYVMQP